MVLSSTQIGISPEEFITQHGDNQRYELIDGELIDREPTGPHEQVAALISRQLNVEIDTANAMLRERLDLPYFIPQASFVICLLS